MTWKIVVEGGNLSFSAAHFITLEGTYEPLHGHNYGISAELTGKTLTPDSYLLDFGVIKAILRACVGELNHRFLMPLHNPYMTVNQQDGEWELTLMDGARFVMPESSVLALDIDNVTAERLAEYVARKVAATLRERGVDYLSTLTVGIAETEMQRAFHTLCFDSPDEANSR